MNKQPLVLNVYSPLHIGNGIKLTSVGEYVSTNQTVRVIDQEQLMPLLNSMGIYDEYIEYILNYAENSHVWDFFTSRGIEKEIKYTREMSLNAKLFNPQSNNILELAIETGRKKYIPGSSLKGALRTMIFAHCIAGTPELKTRIENLIAVKDRLYDIKNNVEKIENDLLKDLFHYFRVEDSEPVGDEHVGVEVAKRVHFFGVKTEGLDNLRECICRDSVIKTNISIVEEKIPVEFNYLKKQGLIGLFQVINRVTENNIDFEINLLKASAEPVAREVTMALSGIKSQIASAKGQCAFMRLGKGKTYLYQVILPFLSANSQKKIISFMVKDEESRFNFPHTRVLTDDNQMFGWVKLSIPAVSLEEIRFYNNLVDNPEKGVTRLKAYFLEAKKACFMINGIVYNEIQLVNQFQKVCKIGEEIEVTVQQVTREGKINQVKID